MGFCLGDGLTFGFIVTKCLLPSEKEADCEQLKTFLNLLICYWCLWGKYFGNHCRLKERGGHLCFPQKSAPNFVFGVKGQLDGPGCTHRLIVQIKSWKKIKHTHTRLKWVSRGKYAKAVDLITSYFFFRFFPPPPIHSRWDILHSFLFIFHN